jgi:PAS domain S-box-containing protein
MTRGPADDRIAAAMQVAMEHMREAVLLIDADARFHYVNEAACRSLGYSREELLNLSVPDIDPDVPASRWPELWTGLQAKGTDPAFETRQKSKDGRIFPVEITASYVEHCGQAYTLALARDITERRRTEDALRFIAQRGWKGDAESFLSALAQYLAETLGVDHVVIDRLAGEPGIAETVALYTGGELAANMTYPLAGTPCNNVIGKNLCVYPRKVQTLFPADSLLVKMGVESYAGIPLWDSKGLPIGLIAVMDGEAFRDEATITQILQLVATSAASALEREISDRRLREREREFRSLAENSPDNIARFDRDLRFLYINPQLERTLGRPAVAVIGTSLHDKANLDKGYIAALMGVFATGQEAQYDVELRDLGDGTRHHSIRMVAERDEAGHITGVLAIGHDVTERKLAGERLGASQRLLAEAQAIARLGSWDWDVIKDRVEWSDMAYEIYTPDRRPAAPGFEDFKQSVHPDDRDWVVQAVEAAFIHDIPYDIEHRVVSDSKGVRVVHAQAKVYRDSQGNPVRMVGTVQDITERKQAERQSQAHLQFMESMDRINQAIQSARDIEQMMGEVLDLTLEIFDCDRAFLVFPCDPAAAGWEVPMERTKPEYPGLHAKGTALPMDAAVAEKMRLLLAAEDPLRFGPESEHPLPIEVAKGFGFQSMMAIALHPRMGKPWEFGLHQCSHPRIWSSEDKRLLREIGRRLADGLTGLLAYRNLRESEQQFRSLAENSPDSIIRYDRSARILYVSAKLQAFFGLSEARLIGRRPCEIWPEGDYADIERAVLEAGEHGASRTIEIVSSTDGGEARYHQVKVVPERNTIGGIIGAIAFGSDITERRRAEEALRQSEERTRLFFEHQMVGTAITSPEKGWLQVNDKLCEMLGYSREELLGMTWAELTHPDDLPPDLAQFERMLAGEIDSYSLEKRYYRKDGTLVPAELAIACVRSTDRTVDYVLVLIEDISERKQAERESQAHMRFMESMDGINRAIQSETELEHMVNAVLDLVLALFDCDRAFLVFPCDPEAASWEAPMERTKPEFPGLGAVGTVLPLEEGVARTMRIILECDEPVAFGPVSAHSIPADAARNFRIRAMLMMALRPKLGKPWAFGLHQCSRERVWSAEERRLLQEIGRRLTDGLTSLLAQRNLQDSERHYRNLVDHLPDPLVRFDADGRFTFANPAVARTFQRPAGSFYGQPLTETDGPGDAATNRHLLGLIRRAFAEGAANRTEAEWLTPEGVRLYDIQHIPETDESGRVASVLALSRDITERKQAEDALRHSEQRYRRLLETVQEGIWVFDSHGVTTFVNPRMGEILGYPPEEMVGRHLFYFMGTRTGRINEGELDLSDQATQDEQPFVLVSQSDEPVYTRFKTKPIFDDAGHYTGAIATVTDITATHHLEKEYQTMLRTALDGFLVVDMDMQIIDVNDAYCALSGYCREEVLAKSLPDVEASKTADEIAACMTQIVEQGGARFESRHRRKDGSLADVEVSVNFRPEKGGRFIAFLHDVTEQKRLENQLLQSQKLEALGRLSGGVAHDFNNMLTAIISCGSILKRKLEEDSPLRPIADLILGSAEKSATLTRQLLAFSRRQIISPKEADLDALVLGMRELLARIIGEEIILDLRLGGPGLTVMVDVGQLDQVLMNLCTNARDAMPEGGTLTVRTAALELDGEWARSLGLENPGPYALLAVADTGTGMSGEVLQQMFEPFFTTKSVGKGTGLGLAIVYGIIKQQNGGIRASSEPGKGTAVEIYLPLTAQARTAPYDPAAPPPLAGTETLLIAEDNADILLLTRQVFEEFGYRVISAVDGEDAVNQFRRHRDRIDLIVADVIMPKKSGKQACDEIREIEPGVKVLFTSGYTADILGKQGVIEEGIDFIAKPVAPEDLLRKAREILDRRPN